MKIRPVESVLFLADGDTDK